VLHIPPVERSPKREAEVRRARRRRAVSAVGETL